MLNRNTWKLGLALLVIVLIPTVIEAQRRGRGFGGGGPGGGGFRGGGGPGGGGFRGGGGPGGFRGGGGPGGGGMRGGGRMRWDPKEMMNQMFQGKDKMDIKTIPAMMRGRLEEYAKSKGIKDGIISRKQMEGYMAERSKRMEQYRKGRDSKRSSDGKGGSSKESEADRLKRYSESYFTRQDRNKDGILEKSEFSSRLRESYKKFDRNRDGKISKDEATNYIKGWMDRRRSDDRRKGKNDGTATVSVDLEILTKRPVVFRVGALPEDLPSWFEETDNDEDGQVGLYEWRNTEKSLSEFDSFDRDRDGFLTPEEMVYYRQFVQADDPKKTEGKTPSKSGTGSIADSLDKESKSNTEKKKSDSNGRGSIADRMRRMREAMRGRGGSSRSGRTTRRRGR